jgi:hypothetical protein
MSKSFITTKRYWKNLEARVGIESAPRFLESASCRFQKTQNLHKTQKRHATYSKLTQFAQRDSTRVTTRDGDLASEILATNVAAISAHKKRASPRGRGISQKTKIVFGRLD